MSQLTDIIDFGEFPSRSLESMSAVTSMHYVCCLYEENKSVQVWMNCDIARMFTKNNLSGDRLPSALDALVLQQRRVLIFFH